MRSTHRGLWSRPRDFCSPILAQTRRRLGPMFSHRASRCLRRMSQNQTANIPKVSPQLLARKRQHEKCSERSPTILVYTFVRAYSSIISGRDVARSLCRQRTKDILVIDVVRDEPHRTVSHREHDSARMITAKAARQLITTIFSSVRAARGAVDAGGI